MEIVETKHSRCGLSDEVNLDVEAEKIRHEILSLLPDLNGKNVLELRTGAGNGLFTCDLAQRARHVTTVDSVEKYFEENIKMNNHLDNVNFVHEDIITTLELLDNSLDVIFSDRMLKGLSDEEVRSLVVKILSWLKEDGLVFFLESCSNEIEIKPLVCRSRTFYDALFQSVTCTVKCDAIRNRTIGFDLIFSRNLRSSVQLNVERDQICWLLQKGHRDIKANKGFDTFQMFLDSKQYSRTSILKRERIYGEGFETTGGVETTKIILDILDLKPGQKVFNVASGIGGGDFYMTEKYGTENLSIDLSSNQIEIAMERAKKYKDIKVQFEIADVTKRIYHPESFDVVYSRDTLKHIKDKTALFTKFFTWLKPGGKLLFTDYCCGELPHSEAFQKYVTWYGYYLCTPQQYGKIVETAGFTNVEAEDRSWQLKEMLVKERKLLEVTKATFIQEFSEDEFHGCLDAWSSKLKNVNSGDHKWVLVYAEKPTH